MRPFEGFLGRQTRARCGGVEAMSYFDRNADLIRWVCDMSVLSHARSGV